jgi:hypothetical protein
MPDDKREDKSFSRRRVPTEAYAAKEEFMQVLHDKDSFAYKPWQFQGSEVCADTLKTTYDEISIWGQHEAMLRPGFGIEEGVVHVPNLFSKVNGVPNDREDFMEKVNLLVRQKNTLFFRKLPMSRPGRIRKVGRVYRSVLDSRGRVDKERLLGSEFWPYRGLRLQTQEAIAQRIAAMCTVPDFWKHSSFRTRLSLGMLDKLRDYLLYVNRSDAKDQYYMKLSTFQVLMTIEEKFCNLLQNFDFPMEIPKIIIYNSGNDGEFTFADAVLLMFMNSMGVDVVIFNPEGTSDIENFVKAGFFDSHTLENTGSRVPYRKGGFFRGVF